VGILLSHVAHDLDVAQIRWLAKASQSTPGNAVRPSQYLPQDTKRWSIRSVKEPQNLSVKVVDVRETVPDDHPGESGQTVRVAPSCRSIWLQGLSLLMTARRNGSLTHLTLTSP